MAELKDDRGFGGGESRATLSSGEAAEPGREIGRRADHLEADHLEEFSRSMAAALVVRELDRRAGRLEEVSRPMAPTLEAPDRIAGFKKEIGRLLEDFDDRLSVVNRHLDRVLDRRA